MWPEFSIECLLLKFVELVPALIKKDTILKILLNVILFYLRYPSTNFLRKIFVLLFCAIYSFQ
jgi:hypothetical protein